jgi:hypothetical protein
MIFKTPAEYSPTFCFVLRNVQTSSEAHLGSYAMDCGDSSSVSKATRCGKLTTLLRVVPKLILKGVILSLPRTLSWLAQGQIYVQKSFNYQYCATSIGGLTNSG